MWPFGGRAAHFLGTSREISPPVYRDVGVFHRDLTTGVTSITSVVSRWLQANHGVHPHSRAGDYTGCEYQGVEITGGHLRGCLPQSTIWLPVILSFLVQIQPPPPASPATSHHGASSESRASSPKSGQGGSSRTAARSLSTRGSGELKRRGITHMVVGWTWVPAVDSHVQRGQQGAQGVPGP